MDNTVIDVLGAMYTIFLEDFKDDDRDGYVDFTSKEIHMRQDNCYELGNFEYALKQNLRHEIIHAFMAESGLQSNWEHTKFSGHCETTIDWFAIQYPKIHKAFERANCTD